jgi:hypothetical protein
MSLADAVVDAGAVRFRPMMLTAAAVIVGTSILLFDPIFQGLAISLIAGEAASLLLTRMAVPVLYFLSERGGEKVWTVQPGPRSILSWNHLRGLISRAATATWRSIGSGIAAADRAFAGLGRIRSKCRICEIGISVFCRFVAFRIVFGPCRNSADNDGRF